MTAAAHARVALDDTVDRAVVETLLTYSPQLHVTDYVELREQEPADSDAGDGATDPASADEKDAHAEHPRPCDRNALDQSSRMSFTTEIVAKRAD